MPPITHPDRVVDPHSGITKGELARIMERVAPRMWPYLDHRILAVLRCPEGIASACFFQRHLRTPLPGLAAFTAEGGDAPDSLRAAIALTAPEGIVSLVQIGAIEIHASPARTGHPHAGSWMILDLDPMEPPFARVAAAARRLRALLEAMELPVFAKITGGKGVHLVTPLDPPAPFEELHACARAIAERAAALWPRIFVATSRRNLRRGRIFVDYLRNHLGASAVAPFSPRARAGLPCAVPVSWPELARLESAQAVPLRVLLEYLESRPDPWEAFLSSARPLPADWPARLAAAAETLAGRRRW